MGSNDQLFHKRKAANNDSLKRRVVGRKPNKRVLIVAEGTTERRYFPKLIKHLDLVGVDVVICDDNDSAPISIVKVAEKIARENGKPEQGGFHQVFCIFDRDTHETYEAAKSKVLDLSKSALFPSKITAITSVPCIEVWFILHFGPYRSPFAASQNKSVGECVVSALTKLKGFGDYQKVVLQGHIAQLLPLTDQAVVNAENGLSDVALTGEENPSTHIHKVIGYMRAVKDEAEAEAKKSY